MNVATKMDEVLEASQDYVGEARKHKRKDSIAEFARGKVLVSVDGRSYAAEVITGTYPNGYCMVYDVINFTPESISIKKIIKPSLGIESPVSGEGLWHEDGFVDKNIQNENDSVNKKNGIDHSLDLSTDTENAEVETEFEGTEDRGWDLPEALENQLIADLESSFVEEDSDGDIYVDGEAKKYAEVSLYAKTKTKGGKVKEKSILETEGRELRDVIRDAFVRGTGNSEQTAYLDEDTAPEDFGDGTITANMTFYGSWDNVKREIGKGTVYFRDKNTGVNIALPVSAMEMENGRTELFAGLRNDDPDYGNFADHSLEQYLGYPSFVRADENFRLYKVERYTISAPSFNYYILPVLTHFSQNIDFLYIYNPY